MKVLILSLVFVLTGCAAMQDINPIANHYKRKIAEDGMWCSKGENVTCYTVKERLQLYEDQRIWTKAEKALLAAAWFCQAGDIATTQVVLDQGGSEQNPLYGSNPNMGMLIGVKTVMTGAIVALADAKPFDRKRLLIGFDAVSCAIMGYNMGQINW